MHARQTIHLPSSPVSVASAANHVQPDPEHVAQRSFSAICLSL
jgi:hypothetical protein